MDPSNQLADGLRLVSRGFKITDQLKGGHVAKVGCLRRLFRAQGGFSGQTSRALQATKNPATGRGSCCCSEEEAHSATTSNFTVTWTSL